MADCGDWAFPARVRGVEQRGHRGLLCHSAEGLRDPPLDGCLSSRLSLSQWTERRLIIPLDGSSYRVRCVTNLVPFIVMSNRMCVLSSPSEIRWIGGLCPELLI